MPLKMAKEISPIIKITICKPDVDGKKIDQNRGHYVILNISHTYLSFYRNKSSSMILKISTAAKKIVWIRKRNSSRLRHKRIESSSRSRRKQWLPKSCKKQPTKRVPKIPRRLRLKISQVSSRNLSQLVM
jgi:hypothetical protein